MKLIVFLMAFTLFLFVGNFAQTGDFPSINSAEAATKAQRKHANRVCRKKYGKRLIKTTVKSNGKFICTYRKRRKSLKKSTYEEVQKRCDKRFPGHSSVFARKQLGKWYCFLTQ